MSLSLDSAARALLRLTLSLALGIALGIASYIFIRSSLYALDIARSPSIGERCSTIRPSTELTPAVSMFDTSPPPHDVSRGANSFSASDYRGTCQIEFDPQTRQVTRATYFKKGKALEQ